MCRYTDYGNDLVAAPEGLDGAQVAALHYQHAPVFMQRFHPVGVAGKDALAKGAAFSSAEGEGLVPIWAAKKQYQQAGQVINYVVLRDWFLPRYKAWKAGQAGPVTVAEVAAAVGSKSTWVQEASQPHTVEGMTTLEKEV